MIRRLEDDPIGFEGGDVNLCAYASNNPILLIDPFGLEPPKNIPSGVSIAANVEKARNMTIFQFYNAVKTGGGLGLQTGRFFRIPRFWQL